MEHSIFATESFWVAVSFIVFILLIIKPVGKIIVKMLDERSEKIKEELGQAIKLKEEAQMLLASYQRKQLETEDEARRIVENAEAEVKRATEAAKADLEASLNRRIEMSMRKVSGYESTVIHQVRNQAVEAAVAAVHALISDHMNDTIETKMVDKVVNEIGAKF